VIRKHRRQLRRPRALSPSATAGLRSRARPMLGEHAATASGSWAFRRVRGVVHPLSCLAKSIGAVALLMAGRPYSPGGSIRTNRLDGAHRAVGARMSSILQAAHAHAPVGP
jgi:hypothetical protein